MRIRFLLVVVVLCGVCSAIPTDSAAAVATATVSSTAGAANAPPPRAGAGAGVGAGAGAGAGVGAGASSGANSAMPPRGVLPGGGEFDEDDDDDYEESMGGGGLSLPLSSAILLSSHHGHHVCLPDVVAFSLLGGRGYPLGTLLPYHHSAPQRLQQELMFLKAFTKAGQHVWKTIASGHLKHPYQSLGNIAKVAGALSGGVNTFAGKIPHGVGIAGGVAGGLSAGAQHIVPVH